MTRITLTRFQKSGGLLSKSIRLVDGKVVADGSACWMSEGTATRISVSNAQELSDVITSLGYDEALALGHHKQPDDTISITTAAKAQPGVGTYSRTKGEFVFDGAAVLLLDFDQKGMPPEVQKRLDERGGFIGALQSLIPGFEKAAQAHRYSTSANIYNTETGEQYPSSGGIHTYLFVKDGADAARFLTTLQERAWLNGFGWLMVAGRGRVLTRSIVDTTVASPERLVFEGPAQVEPPLAQAPRGMSVVEGDLFDTTMLLSITAQERMTLTQLQEAERKQVEPYAEAAKEVAAQTISVKRGITIEQARTVVSASLEGKLDPSDVLCLDDGRTPTVAEVIKNPLLFKDAKLADPSEGQSYGRNKARIYINADGSIFINSLAHGGIIYKVYDPASQQTEQDDAHATLDGLDDAVANQGVRKTIDACQASGDAFEAVVVASVDAPDRWALTQSKMNAACQLGEKGILVAFLKAVNVGAKELRKERKAQEPDAGLAAHIARAGIPPFNELGNACRFRDIWKGRLVYVNELKEWYAYRDDLWVPLGKDYQHTQEMDPVLITMLGDSVRVKELSAQEKSFINHGSQQSAGITGTVKIARGFPELLIKANRFDTHKYALNTQSGVFDLNNWMYIPQSPDLYLTQRVKAAIVSDRAEIDQNCAWRKAVERVIPDTDTRACFQRLMGYSLMFGNPEKLLVFMYGLPNSGKNTLLEAVLAVLDGYADTISFDTLVKSTYQKSGSDHQTDVVAMKGKRMLFADEGEKYVQLRAAFVKTLTGSRGIKARDLNERPQTFEVGAKIWLASNHRVRIDYTDQGLWNRLLIIPMNKTIPKGEQDLGIGDTLRLADEQKQILAWMLEGWLEYKRVGICPSEEMMNEMLVYRQDANPLEEFILDHCVVGDDNLRIHSAEIWAYYRRCMKDTNNYIKSRNGFYECLRAQPGVRWVDNIRIGEKVSRGFIGVAKGHE